MTIGSINLRPVSERDLDVLFGHQLDAEAVWMAAFTSPDPTDRSAFDEHWQRILADPSVIARVVEAGGVVVGHIATFEMFGEREITYWIDRDHWGRGIATEAVRLMLDLDATRPINGRTAADNAASARVLAKCGFRLVGTDRGFANARNEEIEELVHRLSADS